MSLLGKIFVHDNESGLVLTEQVADGLAVMYEAEESDYTYVDEDPATVGLKHVDRLSSRLPSEKQVGFATRISQHVEASRARKGQVFYTARPKD